MDGDSVTPEEAAGSNGAAQPTEPAAARAGLRLRYAQRLEELARAKAAVDARSDVLSRRRGLLMLVIAPLTIFGLVRGLPVWGWAGIGALVAGFVYLVVRHIFVASERSLLEDREKYVKAGQRRLDHEPEPVDPYRPKLPDPFGLRFVKPDHPNASDLDLFGEHSLFVSVSRAETAIGEHMLANWLLTSAPVEVVRERQVAAEELLETPELLEDLSVLGRRAESRGRAEEPLALWGESSPELPVGANRDPALAPRGLLVLAGRLLVPLTIASFLTRHLLAKLLGPLGYFYIVSFASQVGVLVALYGPIQRMVQFVSSRETPFGRFRRAFERIESYEPRSALLVRAVGALRGSNPAARASHALGRLELIMGFADLRHNAIIHIFLNLFFLYDVWVALALERWRALAGRRARGWLNALGELEALASIATYAGEHPTFVWPVVEDGALHIEATELGHPLLPDGQRVTNDARLSGAQDDADHAVPQALLVTGSNMSGKSTYLRSLGLLTVMSFAGLPVCARTARLTPIEAWTSMRIGDALDRGMSHFYAELVRLKLIVDRAQGSGRVLFLLDEILHGTNSRERTIGARGVVMDLLRRGAIGAVSTHDFALVSIAEQSGGLVHTVHFSDHVEGDKMLFDYKLKPGVVESTNAIRLMNAVGIRVEYGV
ncbi:MAG: DNA mismatch repair protein MutS [Polyangiaceae bacterium]